MKKKLPAYGKALLEARRAGVHPHEILLIFGDDWSRRREPALCVRPADYAPGKFDFRMVAGTRVLVSDRAGGAAACDPAAAPPTFGPFYTLLRELAEALAYVEVFSGPFVGLPRALSADDIAWQCRWFDRSARCMRWPSWWDADIDRRHKASFGLWVEDCGRSSGLKAEHAAA